jgi:hypothetical protein
LNLITAASFHIFTNSSLYLPPFHAVASNCKRSVSLKINKKYVRFEVFTAVTMRNAVFWDIKTQFVLHRRHITSVLQSQAA